MFFHPFHYIVIDDQQRAFQAYEWDKIFSWVFGIPLAVIVIYKIVEWGNKK